MYRPDAQALEQKLVELSAIEMVAALGVKTERPAVRRMLRWPFWTASRRVGKTLAQFDLDAGSEGLPDAATRALERFDVRLAVSGECPSKGPVVIISNHPGAYDALALMSACRRADMMVIAADNAFVRALPRVSRHLILVPGHTAERAVVLRRAYSHLAHGGALLQFAAGCIEPDPDFLDGGLAPLRAWEGGTVALARAAARVSGQIVIAGVCGVHSPTAKRLVVTRWAERRGITTLAPLVQIVGRYTDVTVRVAFGLPRPAAALAAAHDDAQILEQLRELMLIRFQEAVPIKPVSEA